MSVYADHDCNKLADRTFYARGGGAPSLSAFVSVDHNHAVAQTLWSVVHIRSRSRQLDAIVSCAALKYFPRSVFFNSDTELRVSMYS